MLRFIKRRRPSRPNITKSISRRLTLEQLEDRTVPSVTIGPGDITTTAWAGSGDTINTDLSNPATLAPGTYVASTFNRLFLDNPSLHVTGSITPLVMIALTSDHSNIQPIAI